jgi:hypothetical protein
VVRELVADMGIPLSVHNDTTDERRAQGIAFLTEPIYTLTLYDWWRTNGDKPQKVLAGG